MKESAQRETSLVGRIRLAARAVNLTGSAVDSSVGLLQRYGGDVISFGMGAAGPDAIPGRALGELAAEILGDPENSTLNYGPTEGEASLRSVLLEALAASGQPASEDTLLITSGGMQGLDLVCKLFLDPGDVVVTESPTYPNALVSIASYEGRVVECPTDDHGIDVDAIPELVAQLDRAPSLIYVIPNHQNPTGVTLSDDRRGRLIELARRYNAVILEDDPYGQLAYDGATHPSLLQLDGGVGNVVSVNTFSKVIAPGLRVGWVLAHPEVTHRMIAARHGMDTCTNVLGQRLVAAFMANHDFDAHVSTLRQRYSTKLKAMLSGLERNFGKVSGARWTRPTGGFFVWLRLPGVGADELLTVAMECGVFFIPGSAFTTTGGFSDCLRLNFTHPSETEIAEGLARLKSAYEKHMAWRQAL